MLSKMLSRAAEFFRREDGPTAVEYAVMMALIIVVCMTTIGTLGTNSNQTYSKVSSRLAGTSS